MDTNLYFRNVADEDDDDDRAASVSIPAGEITGFHMQSATILKVYYNQDNLTEPNTIFLTVTSGKGLDVMKALVDEMNVPNGGQRVIVDEAATGFGGEAQETFFFNSNVTACSIAAA